MSKLVKEIVKSHIELGYGLTYSLITIATFMRTDYETVLKLYKESN